MVDTIDLLASLSSEVVSATRTRRQLSKGLKRFGLLALGKGGWLGCRTPDTVSGLLVEGSSVDIYLTTFLLPVFDELTFFNWSLGRRLVNISGQMAELAQLEEAITAYRTEILPVTSARELVSFVAQSGKGGFYADWTVYLCYLREGKLAQAQDYFDGEKQARSHQSVLVKFQEINPYVVGGDRDGVQKVLNRWETVSSKLFGQDTFVADLSMQI